MANNKRRMRRSTARRYAEAMASEVNRKVYDRGYSDAGASHTKRSMKGFKASSGSAKEDIDENNYTLRQRARMLFMASPIASGAIGTMRTHVIGVGMKLNPSVDADVIGISDDEAQELNRKIKREFALWADRKNTCDALQLANFYQLQQLAFSSWLLSGDVFVLKKQTNPTIFSPYGLRLQIVEADRCCTPNVTAHDYMNWTQAKLDNGNWCYDGIEVNSDGAVVAYHFCNQYPDSFDISKGPKKWTRVKAFGQKSGLANVIHLTVQERPEQYRGVTFLAHVIEPLLQIRRYTEAEIQAAIIESFFTVFIKTEEDPAENPLNETGTSYEGGPPYDDEFQNDTEYEMGPGNVNVLKPGESVEFGDPKRPQSNYDAFVYSVCRQIGASLGVPVDILMQKFDASYSASRAALLEAWETYKMYRSWFIDGFCRVVYEWWMTEAVSSGRISAPGFFLNPITRDAYLKASWVGPAQGQLDPVKELEAQKMQIDNGFTTYEDAAIQVNGSDWYDNMKKLSREKEMMSGSGSENPSDDDQEPDPGSDPETDPENPEDDSENQGDEDESQDKE